MDNAMRLQYLQAMGIDVWVPRHRPVAVPQAAEDESNHVGWAEQREAHHDESPELVDVKQCDVDLTESSQRWSSLHSDQATHHHADDNAWAELQHEVANCRSCKLCETRTQTVFGVGNKRATWLLIGEAPGQNEDLQGEPFVGKAGQLLSEMLRAIGLQREQVYIANMLKCRPPNNRDPQAEEVAACKDFLQRQIALLQPKIIVAVGRIAAQNLLETQQPLSRLRGIRHQLENIPLTVVHHPAYLLRSLPEKSKAWDDLQFALSVYQSLEE